MYRRADHELGANRMEDYMTDAAPSPLRLDAGRATRILHSGVARAHAQELDRRVACVVSAFAAEQEEGYPTLQRNLRAWTQSHLQKADIEATIQIAERIRERFRALVLVGIGGSDLGSRTLHDSLDHPYHNQLPAERRGGAPELYFTGDTFDPKRLLALLDLLESRNLLADTCVNVVSKSGKTGETIAAAMILRDRMRRAGVTDWAQNVVATTGLNDGSVLFQMNRTTPFFGILPVPDGVGGRFSFASPVGLLPFAVTAADCTPRERVDRALAGFAEGHRRMLLPFGSEDNTAAHMARWWHFGEVYGRRTDLVFWNYADDARLADWFVQLYSESVQERGRGLNVIGTRGPTGNHSILNGVLRGPHDKIVLLVKWHDLGPDAVVPEDTGIGGDLRYFEGLPLTHVQSASCHATAADFIDNGVSTATLTVARRDEYHLFLLMRTLMDAVAIKGRLQNLHVDADGAIRPDADLTYRQDGVEGYKVGTRKNAAEMQRNGDD
jgi:glucose-6-phosphate isomerase